MHSGNNTENILTCILYQMISYVETLISINRLNNFILLSGIHFEVTDKVLWQLSRYVVAKTGICIYQVGRYFTEVCLQFTGIIQ